MKRIAAVLLLLLLSALPLAAFAEESGISLNRETWHTYVGRTATLKATPANGVKWVSTDASVATVNAKGVVTARKAGECRVVARLADGSAAECVVVVRTPAKKVTLNKAAVNLDVGKTYQLKATVTPANATVPAVQFKSSNTAVATVDANGVVTGHKKGSATITATAAGGVTATSKVNVRTPVTGISLSSAEITVYKGQSAKTVKAVVKPASAYNTAVTWKSSDTKIATVNANGAITGKKAGECVVTATTHNGFTAQVKVRVKIPATSVKVTTNKKNMDVGGSGSQMVATVLPSDASSKAVVWKSSNPKVAKVDENGYVTPVGRGSAVITATTSNKKTGSVTVNVRVVPSGIAFSTESTTVYKGSTKALKASVQPANSYNTTLTWKSSDTKIAAVNSSGVVTGKKTGDCVITATTVNGISATIHVHVRVAATSVKVTGALTTLEVGGSGVQLKAAVSPSDASNKAVTWKSNNPKAATVDENGYVTPVGPGYAQITASAHNGKAGTVGITVRVMPSSVTLNKSEITLYKNGKTASLKATVGPAKAYSKQVTWKTSNGKVASVNANGVVTPIGPGECTITAIAAGGKVKAQCDVTVNVAVSGVTLNQKSLTLVKGGKTSQLSVKVAPSDATDKTVTWTSSNAAVATVDEKGLVAPGSSAGSATITATSSNGKSASVTVKVVEPATSISVSQTSLSLKTGKNTTLTANVGPSNAGNKTVTWISSDKNVAVVDSNGKVYAKSEGTCVISAVANGSVSALKAECQVTVSGKPTKYVAITFDGGPTTAATASILNTLDTYGIRATFFMLGANADKNPALAKRVSDAGHELGNHSYTHPRLTDLPLAQAKAEIEKCDNAVYKATGRYPTVIRPPYGAINKTLAKTQTRAFVNWNVVSHDATYNTASQVISCTLNGMGDHAVILCHDTVTWTAEAIKTIIPTLLSRGYTFVTVSEMMEICGYKPGSSVVFAPALIK